MASTRMASCGPTGRGNRRPSISAAPSLAFGRRGGAQTAPALISSVCARTPPRSEPSGHLATVQPWFSSPMRLAQAHALSKTWVPLVVARHRDDGLHRKLGVRHAEQLNGCRGTLGAGAHQTEHAAGRMGVRRPDLGAVDDVVVAVRNGAAFTAKRGSDPGGSRIALTPIVLAEGCSRCQPSARACKIS